MCGISAIIRLNKGDIHNTDVVRMSNIIRHRGPDDEGFLFINFLDKRKEIYGGNDTPDAVYASNLLFCPHEKLDINSWYEPDDFDIALAHRRLSIIDLTPSGHQPMSYDDQRYWIVFNGEIYNYLELKTELENLGHRFVTNSDTEVILASYAQWGKECLHHFNGMWAFIIVDTHKGIAFAARDRFGIKPIYYWFSEKGFLALASEIKQFTVLPGWNAKMNGQRVYNFLNWGLIDHTNETLFRDVYQLRGGEAFEARISDVKDELPVYRWYELPSLDDNNYSFEAASARFKELFTDSVRLHLRADVPVGSCLSGGLDSSSIVCTVNDFLKESAVAGHQKTFSACSSVKKYDERDYIDVVIKSKGIDAHYTYPDLENLFSAMENIVWYQDEPFASTSIYAQWRVFKLANEANVKVMLDGQGADEQLAGYDDFYGPRLIELLKAFKIMSILREIRQTKINRGFSELYILEYVANFLLPSFITRPLKKAMKIYNVRPVWINMEILKAQPIDPYLKLGLKVHSIKEYSRLLTAYTSLPMLLHWEDRNSMAHHIESRVPFLDYRLIEFNYNLPDAFKLSDGVTKKVLRSGMKGVLPELIRMRMDKLGFVTPEETWVKNACPQRFIDALKESIKISQGVLTDKAIIKAQNMIDGKEAFNPYIWRLICFGAWVKRYNVKV
ncbi:MAG: asparagine synthase (glutamine-hydrolyzing) [Candidatus Doudnabacteria bacterium]